MKNFLLWLFTTLLILAVWTVLNLFSTTEGWFRQAIAPKDDAPAFMTAAEELLTSEYRGNFSFLLIRKGKLFAEFHGSKGSPVNRDTIYGVSSLSKWVTAYGVLTLVETGKIDLDAPVSTYLSGWSLPPSEFDNNQVTVRRLLSHTAGITDGLGHNGFASAEEVQPLAEHLSQALDTNKGVSGKVAVGLAPGSEWMYSGGSYNLLQMIVEDVSGKSFFEYMQTAVFNPLGMTRSGYSHSMLAQDNNVAEYFNQDSKTQAYPHYTSLAATGLFSTPSDMFRFVQANTPSNVITNNGLRVLSDEALGIMRQSNASKTGLSIWGAGPMLFVDNSEGDFIIGHGGMSPNLNTTARVNPHTGNGIIIFETGNRALASDTAMQWTLWEAGKPGMYILRNALPEMVKRVLVGYLVIFILSLIVAWRLRRTSGAGE